MRDLRSGMRMDWHPLGIIQMHKRLEAHHFKQFLKHFFASNPPDHASEQPPCEMALYQAPD